MKVTPARVADVLIVEPRVFGDERGFFLESFNQKVFNEAVGREIIFVQDCTGRWRRRPRANWSASCTARFSM
jgi:dTDP-4-dehydrorhamnose 3,5-epimerase